MWHYVFRKNMATMSEAAIIKKIIKKITKPFAGFVLILPSAGLYLTQHFLECRKGVPLVKI